MIAQAQGKRRALVVTVFMASAAAAAAAAGHAATLPPSSPEVPTLLRPGTPFLALPLETTAVQGSMPA
eukprot:179117-Pelagomonas_calceolata.AAC.3